MPSIKDSIIPGRGKVWHTKSDRNAFKEPTKEAQFQAYRDSVGLAGNISCTDAFQNALNKRTSNLSDLAKRKVKVEGETIPEILIGDETPLKDHLHEHTEEMQKSIHAFSNALEKTDKFKTAEKNFEERMATLNTVIQQDPPTFNLAAIASYLKEEQSAAESAIKAQHAHEIKKITNLLNSNSIEQETLRAFQLGDPDPDHPRRYRVNEEKLTKFKNDILGALKKSHEETLTNFKQSIEKETKRLHHLAQRERDRINYLASMHEKSTIMRKTIDELAAKKAAESNRLAEVSIENADNNHASITFKDIKVEELKIYKTIIGHDMHYNEETKNFSMTLPWFGPLYWRSARVQSDLDSMAMAVRATGKNDITFTINDNANEERAMEIARKSYLAACKAGFNPNPTSDPDNKDKENHAITIKVNGKEIKIDELFKDHSSSLEKAKTTYSKNQKKSKNYLEKGVTLKQEVENLRTTVETKRPEPREEAEEDNINIIR